MSGKMENFVCDLSDADLLLLYKYWYRFQHKTGVITDDMPLLRETVDKYADMLDSIGVSTGPVSVFRDDLLEEIARRWAVIEENEEPQIEMTEDEKLDFVAARILRGHMAAFEELANGRVD